MHVRNLSLIQLIILNKSIELVKAINALSSRIITDYQAEYKEYKA